MTRMRLVLSSLALVALGACDDPQRGWQVADREFRGFRDVYPVLMRDCGFHTCHGSEDRPFRIYGPGRARLTDDVRALEALTGAEISLAFSAALSMIDAEHPERSLLLTKPLALEAGGAAHGGIDDFGRNVYRTKNDDGYKAIEKWVLDVPKLKCNELDDCCELLPQADAPDCMDAAERARIEGDAACTVILETFCSTEE